MTLKMKIFISPNRLFKFLKNFFCFIKQYYFTGMLIFSFLWGGGLFYLSYLRSVSISPVTVYCLENKDTKVCSKRSLRQKRLQNREIKEVIFTKCSCRDLHLLNVKVDNSDFRDNQFGRASFKNVSFLNVDLFKSSFYGSVLDDVVFENSDLGGVVFNFATFRNVYFKNVDLRSTVFIGTRFKNTYYNQSTKLPFSKEQASRMGLLLKE